MHDYRTKLGTMPACLIIDRRFKIEVGRKVRVREKPHGSKWFTAKIDRIDHEIAVLFLSCV